jgi:bifunctional DNase/RNase
MFISRASEGAVSLEWVMNQPISIRKKYLEEFRKEMEERQERLKGRK